MSIAPKTLSATATWAQYEGFAQNHCQALGRACRPCDPVDALALLDPAVRPADTVEIDVRGRALPCEVVTLPFVPSHVR
jgi:hypothetical protein